MTIQVPGLGQHLTGWMTARELFIEATGEMPYEWQEDYLKETRDSVVLKGRQVGASTAAGVIAVRRARYWPNSLCAIVSPSLKQSTEVKDRAKEHVQNLGMKLVRDSSSMLELQNGSRILSLPGSAKSVRGWSVHLLVLDEAAYIEPETFLAARATVAATGGRVIIQSTPEAPFGYFWDTWNSDDPRWAKFSVASEEVGTIDPVFLANELELLGPEKYAREYLGQFGSPGLGLVDPTRLRELKEEGPSPWTGPIWVKP